MNCAVCLRELIGITLMFSQVMPVAQSHCNTSPMTNQSFLVATALRLLHALAIHGNTMENDKIRRQCEYCRKSQKLRHLVGGGEK